MAATSARPAAAATTALGLRSFADTRNDPVSWGRLAENAVGGHLLNGLESVAYEITYWRERHHEVDYIVRTARGTWALEVKSGLPGKLPGLAAFRERHPGARPMFVGSVGIPLEDFFATEPRDLFVRS